ncbi:MAG: hypothetical protein EOO03_03075 [Chitinophagaceae bacterium]|nr:MAG: hypothetical protein EOO03_03075 [Chitinophagaceae bacterium]
MKKVSQYITAYALLFLVMVPLCLPVYHFFAKLNIKKQMMELLQERPLQRVRVASEDVVWMDKHEIWVNEQMFDIASVELRDGVYYFTGLYDEAETAIVKQQMETQGKSTEEAWGYLVVTKWLNNACIPPAYHIQTFKSYIPYSFPLQSGKIPQISAHVITPPPRYTTYHIA